MNQLTANPPKRAKKKVQPLIPIVKIGECVFAARGKVSFVKATNLPAQRKFAEILLSETLRPSGTKGVCSLGVSVVKGRKKGVFINDTDPTRNDVNGVVFSAVMATGISDLKGESACCHASHFDLRQQMENINDCLERYPKAGILVLLERNESTHLPSKEDAPRYLEMLEKFAEKKGVAIVLVFNQFFDRLRQGKNGPYAEKAFNRCFAVAKLTYEGGPGFYRLESCRAPKGHDFWPISVNLETDGSIGYHQGIERNRVPVPNKMFVAC